MSTKEQKKRVELLQGSLDLLILRTVQLGPANGYVIAKAIEFNSDAVLQVKTSKWDKLAGAITRILRPAEQGARQESKP